MLIPSQLVKRIVATYGLSSARSEDVLSAFFLSHTPKKQITHCLVAINGLLASGAVFAQNLPTAVYGEYSSTQWYFDQIGANGNSGSDSNYDLISGNCTPGDGDPGGTPSAINETQSTYAASGYTSVLVALSQGGNGGDGGSNTDGYCPGYSGRGGGSGAPGGEIAVTLNVGGAYFSVESGGTGLFVQSLGGNGGDGGTTNQGGNGGNGGNGGGVVLAAMLRSQITLLCRLPVAVATVSGRSVLVVGVEVVAVHLTGFQRMALAALAVSALRVAR